MATWREVAEALANRLYYQAYNCPIANGTAEPDGHIITFDNSNIGHISKEAVQNHNKAECPFCQDTAAYQMYARKKATDG